jgi:hypothetical protein
VRLSKERDRFMKIFSPLITRFGMAISSACSGTLETLLLQSVIKESQSAAVVFESGSTRNLKNDGFNR